ncbi:hypothetical protein AA0113_g9557 [Alternaria arborescens]|uniref:Uncharacterized protein n=1 Tax=Alternaria arborescens TaxID=156630 RepID=A0A4Q4R8Z9_9PLEO|nr:hypothetical protein AA0111_g2703 [Alternaria arborescens]RYN29118.1 hypothetical protein AA0112_g7398 [Alternaria arborescens]RYO36538.1 hypothetical protein AA0111_g2703 [Alternaria arborescens]RYO52919.1 hypothetical protein AA0113_g9557 [Alternaria arborescens]
MKLSILLSMLAGTAVVSAAADVFGACTPEADCCFSTKGACQRQSSFAIERYYECGTIKLCPDYGVSLQACKADCCSIASKGGRGCPGK